MKFWKENQSAQIRGIPNDLKAEELFSPASIRKFMWTYVPVKERPRLLPANRSRADTAFKELRRVVKHFWKWERVRLPRTPSRGAKRPFDLCRRNGLEETRALPACNRSEAGPRYRTKSYQL